MIAQIIPINHARNVLDNKNKMIGTLWLNDASVKYLPCWHLGVINIRDGTSDFRIRGIIFYSSCVFLQVGVIKVIIRIFVERFI